MRRYHYAIVFDEATNSWDIDIDTEESIFPDGTIYNSENREWEYGYAGEGEFTGREEELSNGLQELLNEWNLRLRASQRVGA